MHRFSLHTLALAGVLTLAACDDGSVFDNATTPPPARAPLPAQANLPAPVEGLDPAFHVPTPEDSPLLDARSPAMSEQAPDKYRVTLTTSRGDIVIEVTRQWSPNGADRFYNLARHGFYDGARFFRVLPGFMAQFGLPGDPKLTNIWRNQPIRDEPVIKSNTRGMVTYAMGGPNTRTSQIFINYGNNAGLDARGFTPFGEVVEGMENVDALYSAYGEGPPSGRGPNQGYLMRSGNDYLSKAFPNLDYIISAKVEPLGDAVAPAPAEEPADEAEPPSDPAPRVEAHAPAANSEAPVENEAPADEDASARPVTPLD